MANLEVMLRYAPAKKAVAALEEHDRILEIGGGAEGFSSFTKRTVFAADVHFSKPINDNVLPCVASAYKLPFLDKSFEAVISIDMLEHIPAAHSPGVINELIRVSRRIIVLGFPSGERAAEMEKKINALHRKKFNADHFWLSEHIAIGLPDADRVVDELRRSLPESSGIKVINNVNLSVFYLIRYLDILLGYPSLGRDFQGSDISSFKRELKRLASIICYPLFRFANMGECYRKIYIITMPFT